MIWTKNVDTGTVEVSQGTPYRVAFTKADLEEGLRVLSEKPVIDCGYWRFQKRDSMVWASCDGPLWKPVSQFPTDYWAASHLEGVLRALRS